MPALLDSLLVVSRPQRRRSLPFVVGFLDEGEATLRKIFDPAPDNIIITRMSDGATLEVNREFLKAGYTREEVISI